MLCLCLSGGLQAGIRKSNLKVLYVGGSPDVDYVGNRPDSAVLAQSSAKRMASFDKMLKRYFRQVTVIRAQAYRPELSDNYDVTVIPRSFGYYRPELAVRYKVFPVRNLSASCMAVRFCNDYFPCSVKGCSTGSLRGGFDRRSRQVASVLLCDSADHYTGYFLQPGNTALSGIPGVQRTVHHHTGRTEKLYNTDFAFDLQQCVQTV